MKLEPMFESIEHKRMYGRMLVRLSYLFAIMGGLFPVFQRYGFEGGQHFPAWSSAAGVVLALIFAIASYCIGRNLASASE